MRVIIGIAVLALTAAHAAAAATTPAQIEQMERDRQKAFVDGDTAVLTGRYDDVHVTDGVRSEAHALFTRIFVKAHGRWQAVAYQQTNLPAN